MGSRLIEGECTAGISLDKWAAFLLGLLGSLSTITLKFLEMFRELKKMRGMQASLMCSGEAIEA